MKKVAAAILASATFISVLTGCSAGVNNEPEETTAAELPPAKLEDDYYRFINEDLINSLEFEYGTNSVDAAFDQEMISDQIESVIEGVVAGDGYAKGSEEDIIKHAYEMFLDYDFENEPIPDDLVKIIDEIDNAKTVDDLLGADAKLVKDFGMVSILNITPEMNFFNPKERILNFSQISGILNTTFTSMRDRKYAVNQVMDDVILIMTTKGYDKDTAEQYGKELATLALDLYGATDMDIIDAEMDYEYYKLYSSDDIKATLSNINLDKYLSDIGFDTTKVKSFCLSDAEQLKALNKIFSDENINALKSWEIGRVYSTYRRYIAPHYPRLAGFVSKDYSSMHDQAIDEVSQVFMLETDPLYVEQYYTKEMDKALRDMCDDIKGSYRNLISGATWLTEGTREELLKKLDNIVYVTGTNLERHDNSKYVNVYGKNYYELYINYQKIDTEDMIASLTEPVSRTDVAMQMQIFNACYNPSLNNINITCAITNAPFFDVNADYYTNLGGLGMVIAHEMGHAFDSNCIVFNSKGEYDPSWITQQDMDILVERNEKAVRYFEDNFTVFGAYHVDGEQTLGENYADLGAMECITLIAKTKEDRMKLFENYAHIWCEKSTDEAIINQIEYDAHSPSVIRVNAVLSTLDAFYETYGIKEGDGMYIAPEERISRWY